MQDVIVIGGSFAGLSAALQLARARRSVLVVDAARPRNRFAEAAHGFLGQDGRPPRTIVKDASAQLLAYPSARIIDDEALSAERNDGRFDIRLKSGEAISSRRLILATGVSDELPPINGLAERWGRTVLHCPYCHGYEFLDRPIGVIANHPNSPHQALLVSDWGPVTYFTQGAFEPSADEIARFDARGIVIERNPVVELVGSVPALEAARLDDGRLIALEAMFIAPQIRMTSGLAEEIGCAFSEGPMGRHILVDEWGLSSVPGVYAAGDAASARHSATFASASGVAAGAGAHQSLLREAYHG